jgi:flagellar basal body-associated protein FliL
LAVIVILLILILIITALVLLLIFFIRRRQRGSKHVETFSPKDDTVFSNEAEMVVLKSAGKGEDAGGSREEGV